MICKDCENFKVFARELAEEIKKLLTTDHDWEEKICKEMTEKITSR